jgi:3-oxoacyl-[acyl-carrier protein] reductase
MSCQKVISLFHFHRDLSTELKLTLVGAVEQATRVLAKDLGSKGITVNVVSPGPTDTPLFRNGKPQQVIDMITRQIPSNRLGTPDDIAPVVAFLSSDAAAWVNGQNLRTNGVSARVI